MDRDGYRGLKDWFERHRGQAAAENVPAREELRSLDPSRLSRWFEQLFWESDAAAREELLRWAPELPAARTEAFLRELVASEETRIGEKRVALEQLRRMGGDLVTQDEADLEAAWRFVTAEFPGTDHAPGGSRAGWQTEWACFEALPGRTRALTVRGILERYPEQALSFLEFGLQQGDGVPGEILEPLAESPHADAARLLLLAFRKAGNKALQKRIKKLNHKRRVLGQSACDFEEGARGKVAVWTPPVPPRPVGLLSLSEFPDSRIVWVIRHRLPKGMVVFGGVLHDLKGLVHFFLLELSRREAEKFEDSLLKNRELTVVETDPAYVATLLAAAARKGVPEDEQEALAYQTCRPLLKEMIPATPPEAPIYGVFSRPEQEGAPGDPLGESGRLLRHPGFQSWQVEPDRLLPHLARLEEISESRIVVNPLQKRERSQAFYREIAKEIFSDPEYRALWQRRVEDMAWVLYRKGSVSESKRLCEVGRCLQDPARDLSRIGFVVLLVEKPLEELLRRKKATDRDKPSLIIKP